MSEWVSAFFWIADNKCLSNVYISNLLQIFYKSFSNVLQTFLSLQIKCHGISMSNVMAPLHQGQLRSMVGFPSTWLEINPSRLDFQPLVRNPTAGWYSTHWMVRIPTILPLCIKSITSPPNCWHFENVSEIKSESGSKASDLHFLFMLNQDTEWNVNEMKSESGSKASDLHSF